MNKLNVSLCGSLSSLETTASNCTVCAISKGRQKVVFSNLKVRADVMVIGEAPGYNEDKDGEPFTGLSGKLLLGVLNELGLHRGNTYLANVLKCRPTENRLPSIEEKESCTPFLDRQIELVSPKLIICVGITSTSHVLGLYTPHTMGSLRGMHKVKDRDVCCTWHPAYVLRQQDKKPELKADIEAALKHVGLSYVG